MKLVCRIGSTLFVGATLLALVLGGLTLISAPVQAGQEPLCGPTFQWICSGAGPDVLFEGTVCEKAAFEKESGTTCELDRGD